MRYKRNYVPGGTYFITIVLADRKSCLLVKNINTLKRAFKSVMHKHPFKIDAIVILPDHLHMVITLPDGNADYSKRIRLIKTHFSKSLNAGLRADALTQPTPSDADALTQPTLSSSRKHKSETGIWQRRFWEHTIRDERDFRKHVNYIHYNPVKHGYVINPMDWMHSSIHQYIKSGLLPENWSADVDVYE